MVLDPLQARQIISQRGVAVLGGDIAADQQEELLARKTGPSDADAAGRAEGLARPRGLWPTAAPRSSPTSRFYI